MISLNSVREAASIQYPAEAKIGFVPTMGFLHEGHLSLVKASKQASDITIVSIYVNPSQFGENEDLDSYPRDLERDMQLLEDLGVDYVFMPTDEMMYPAGYGTWVELPEMGSLYCGASRPGHIRGVSTVVLKLLNIIRPTKMYMGEKDYQQLTILRNMVKDLNLPVKIVGCPSVREEDGLAMSSRNSYLNPAERVVARSLYQALHQAQAMVSAGFTDAGQLIDDAKKYLENCGARVDYVAIVDPYTLQPEQQIKAQSRMLMAAWVGQTRLIDNIDLGCCETN